MTAKSWEKNFDEIGFGNQARIVGTQRIELKDFIKSTLKKYSDEVEKVMFGGSKDDQDLIGGIGIKKWQRQAKSKIDKKWGIK